MHGCPHWCSYEAFTSLRAYPTQKCHTAPNWFLPDWQPWEVRASSGMLKEIKQPIDETGASYCSTLTEDRLVFCQSGSNAKLTAGPVSHHDKLSSLPEACWQSLLAREAEPGSMCSGLSCRRKQRCTLVAPLDAYVMPYNSMMEIFVGLRLSSWNQNL